MPTLDLHVSLSGSAKADGSASSPISSPFNALKHILALRHQGNRDPITVHLHAGVYYLNPPLYVEPRHGPLTVQPYGNDAVTLSAGFPVRARWTPFRDGIFSAPLPDLPPGFPGFSLLYLNGRRMTRARFPKYDPSVPGQSGYVTAKEGIGRPTRSVRFDPATWSPRKWSKPHLAVLHGFPACYWGSTHYRVAGIDYDNHLLHLGEGGWQLNVPPDSGHGVINDRSRFYVENVFEELTDPGEWFFDPDSRTLYVYPPAGVDIHTALVEVSGYATALYVQGDAAPASHVTLRNLRFAHTAPTFLDPYFAPSRGDWSLARSAAVLIDTAENVTLDGCHFDQLGGNAVFVSGRARHVTVSNSLFNDLGESGVCVVGDRTRTLGTQGPNPADVTVHNCHMHHLGYYGKQTAGVFVSQARRVTVSHCLIHDLPRSAVTVNDNLWGGHVIEHNHVFNTVLETTDHGPFNAWGRDTYWCMRQSHGPASHDAGRVKEDAQETTVIRNNLFVDRRGWGIDLDDGASNYLVTDNLCVGISVKLREGDFRTVENNIFYHPANPPGIHVGYENNSDVFRRNIIVLSSAHDVQEADVNFDPGKHGGDIYKFILPPAQGAWLKECDHNLFFNDKGFFTCTAARRGTEWWRPEAAEGFTLEQWQAFGFDQHSLFADPLFRDPAGMDFTLAENSPARRVGFVPFPLDQFGLTADFPARLRGASPPAR